ncbi:MAG TPA: ABC transporter substrate-binding protein [Xanthobacteraceae bacterium]|jgi:NitT/TauT family transport system substrate-binding protein
MRIRLAENFRAVFYAPFYAAHALGFYEREGVELELVGSPAPAAAAPALLDGTIDLTWGGPMRVMKARDAEPGSGLMCFCEVVTCDPFFLVGHGRRRGHEFRLTELSSLKFAKVSEVPTPWLCLQLDLREQGLDPARLDCAPDSTMRNNLEKLRRGELDVVQLFEPYASLAVKEGAGEILYAASARGPTSYTTFLATRDAIERNRDAFMAMTRGIRHMQRWIGEYGGEDLAQVTAGFYPDVGPQILAAALARYRDAGLWGQTTAVSFSGFARLAESLLAGGFISRRPVYEDCVEQSLC